jgi:hypothetical protein
VPPAACAAGAGAATAAATHCAGLRPAPMHGTGPESPAGQQARCCQ